MPAITDWNDVVAIAMSLFLTVSSLGFVLCFIGGIFFSSDDDKNEKTN